MDGPLRVLYIDNTSTFGGAIISLSEMVAGLVVKGIRPVVVSGQSQEVLCSLFPDADRYSCRFHQPWVHPDGSLKSPDADSAVWVNKLKKHSRTLYWLARRDLLEAIRLAAVGRRYRIDLVHCNNGTDSQLNGFLTARVLGVPCVAHHRALLEDASGGARFNAALPNCHIAISEAVRETVVRLVPAGRPVSVVHNAVNLRDFRPRPPQEGLRGALGIPDGIPVVSHFGRLVPWKGQLEFLQALAQIRGTHGFHALIIGDRSDGPADYEELLRREVGALGLTGMVSFTGHRGDIPDLMNLTDLVVHSSIEPEPFGRVIIEAMASGKPLVAADSGGPPEVLRHGVDGLLVQPSDPVALGQAIATLLADEPLRHRMGAAGLKRAHERFSQEVCADAVIQIYRTLVRGDHRAMEPSRDA